MTNPYELLQVGPRASEAVIKAACRELLKQHQSDGRAIAALQDARDTLLDDKKRAAIDNPPKAGAMIGQYRILSQIAEGGFGITYKAEHALTKSLVCLKHAQSATAMDEQIMLEEARTIWDLRHYSLPAMRDVLKHKDGSLVLVMSYIPGPTLEQYVTQHGALDPESVCWITSRVLNALKYLHFHGVVHGDIKPHNIIIQEDIHSVVLVDFGLSVIRPTADSHAGGYTPHYASPEHTAGTPLVPESDFFSLGVTMVHALGGDIEALKVPDGTPRNLVGFIKNLIRREVLSRPNFRKQDLCDTLEKVRIADFGRASTDLKPLRR